MDTRLTVLETTEKKCRIADEVARLAKMTVPELRSRHQELFGEPARSHHKDFLVRQIAWRLQAAQEGELPEEARQWALAVAREAPLRVCIESAAAARGGDPTQSLSTQLNPEHDSRLPMPGALLVKQHRGATHVVKVLDNGFDYGGRWYRSLSAIAQEITGTKWNGYAFFSLTREVANGRR